MSALSNRISALELELASLRLAQEKELNSKEETLSSTSSSFERYGRQLILPSFGASAQAALLSLKVLVIGCGGLGCPAATYLAGAGVGSITLVDDDVVSLSNLHRQVAHAEAFSFGNPVLKATSLASFLTGLNSSIDVKTVCERFTAKNGLSLAMAHDVIVDASDNAASRYLINDAAVLAGKPLVSGAALGSDGQVSVYHFNNGPCYRCVFPVAPHPSASRSCADAGVLGPIAGVIGSLQALEVMKIAAEIARQKLQQKLSTNEIWNINPLSPPSTTTTSSSSSECCVVDDFSRSATLALKRFTSSPHAPSLGAPLSGSLLVFDGSEARVRVAKLGKKRSECAVCGDTPSITSLNESESWSSISCLAERDDPTSTSQAVEKSIVNAASGDDVGVKVEIVPNSKLFEYQSSYSSSSSSCDTMIVLDVRSSAQFAIESLPGALNIPLQTLRSNFSEVSEAIKSVQAIHSQTSPILCLCRRGNDSKHAARMLTAEGILAVSVEGGIEAYLKSQGKKPY